MNKTINEIINNYTSGKTPVGDTNKALKEAGAGFSFQPGKNALTAEEIAATKVGAPARRRDRLWPDVQRHRYDGQGTCRKGKAAGRRYQHGWLRWYA